MSERDWSKWRGVRGAGRAWPLLGSSSATTLRLDLPIGYANYTSTWADWSLTGSPNE